MKKSLPILLVSVAFVFSACSTNDKPKAEGTRLSVLEHAASLKTSSPEDDFFMEIPDPVLNNDWLQAGGNTSHLMGNLELSRTPVLAWKTGIGTGTSEKNYTLAEPIVSEDRVFAIDAVGILSAFDLKTGNKLWELSLKVDNDNDTLGGTGLAYADDKVFVTTGSGNVYAVSADEHKIIWTHNLYSPIRSAPTIAKDKVFIITLDNHVTALSVTDGEQVWKYDAVPESTVLLGSAAPAVYDNILIAALPSGEIFGLAIDTGIPVFSDVLTPAKQSSFVTGLSSIRGRVVITEHYLIASSGGDLTVALSLENGERVWERSVGSANQPWVVDNTVFLISVANEVIALDLTTGKVIWTTPLPKWKDEQEKEDKITWNGPIMAHNRLIVTSTNGDLLGIEPQTGNIIASSHFSEGFVLSPIVADGTLLLMDKDGTLKAFH